MELQGQWCSSSKVSFVKSLLRQSFFRQRFFRQKLFSSKFFVKSGVFRKNVSCETKNFFDERHFLTKNTIFLIFFVKSFVRQIFTKDFDERNFDERNVWLTTTLPEVQLVVGEVYQIGCSVSFHWPKLTPFFRVRISSTFFISSAFTVLRPPTLVRPKLYFDLNFTSTFLAKLYFDLFGQTLLRPKLYYNLYVSTNKKSRFDKRSKYRGRSKRVEVKRWK